MTGLLDVVFRVVTALDACAIRYTVGGSLASSFSGEPRASIDADIVVDMDARQAVALVDALGGDFYADPEAFRRAAIERSTVNAIHQPSSIKIDLFVAHSELDHRQLERRRPGLQIAEHPVRIVFMHSPEDIVLQKLHWYRMGGEVSERQWRDVLSVIVVQGKSLDRSDLTTMAKRVELTDLLERAFAESARAR